jgi:hypothetical protein
MRKNRVVNRQSLPETPAVSNDRTPRESRGRKWGRSEQNRDTVRATRYPVQIRKNPWGWPYIEARGMTAESLAGIIDVP